MICNINQQTSDGEPPVEASMMFLGCFACQTAFLKKGCTHPTLQFFMIPNSEFWLKFPPGIWTTKCNDRIWAMTSPTFHHGGWHLFERFFGLLVQQHLSILLGIFRPLSQVDLLFMWACFTSKYRKKNMSGCNSHHSQDRLWQVQIQRESKAGWWLKS